MLNKFFLYFFVAFFLAACSNEYVVIHEDVVTVGKNKLRDDTLVHDFVIKANFSRL